jgi:hypothetical protein
MSCKLLLPLTTDNVQYCCYRVKLCFWPLTGPLSVPQMIYEWIWSSGGMILTGENRRNRRKTCHSAALSTKNPTLTEYNISGTKHIMISPHPSDYLEQVRTICSASSGTAKFIFPPRISKCIFDDSSLITFYTHFLSVNRTTCFGRMRPSSGSMCLRSYCTNVLKTKNSNHSCESTDIKYFLKY